jgi:hypothetical protein
LTAVGVDLKTHEIYMAGTSTSQAIGDQSSPGLENLIIAKYDSSGSEIWTKFYGSNGDQFVANIAVDSQSQDFYICGSTTGDWNKQLNKDFTHLSTDSLLIRFDSGGNQIWSKLWGSLSDDFCWGLALSSDFSLVYVSGFEGSAAYIAQFKAANEVLSWKNSIEGTGAGAFTSVLLFSDNEIYAVGYLSDALDSAVYLGGENDIAIVKFDSQGARQWSSLVGSAGTDYSYFSSIDVENRRIYISGITTGALDGFSNAGDTDLVCLIVSTEDGSVLYQNQIGSGGSDYFFASYFDPYSGIFFAAGASLISSVGKYYSGGQSDSLLIWYNSTAHPVKIETWGTCFEDTIQGIAGDVALGRVYLAGKFNNTAAAHVYQTRGPSTIETPSGLSLPVIIGAAIGGIVGIAIMFGVLFKVMNKKSFITASGGKTVDNSV